MKIRTVEYRETVSFGNYQNLSVAMSAEVGDHESPETALDELARRVKSEAIRRADEREQSDMEESNRESQARRHESYLREVCDQITVAESRWERIKEFLAKFGVDVSDLEIPY